MLINNSIPIFLYEDKAILVIYSIFIVLTFIAILLTLAIAAVILSFKHLHTVTNFLTLNNCTAIVFGFLPILLNITFYVFEKVITDQWCRILAYFHYCSLTVISFSYVVQSLSRLLFIVYSKQRHIFTVKVHLLLISVHYLISFLFPISSLITKDITYRRHALCLIPSAYLLHITYFYSYAFLIPMIIVVMVYLKIHHFVSQSKKRVRSMNEHFSKRDIQMIKTILILSSIFMLSAVPGVSYMLFRILRKEDSEHFYLICVSSIAMTMTADKIYYIWVTKSIRTVLQNQLNSCFGKNSIQPGSFIIHSMR